MSVTSRSEKLENLFGTYRSRLDSIPDELFSITPTDGGWSYAEVYSHILQATLASGLALEKCTMASSKPSKKGRSFLGIMVLSFGRFPPIKIKVPPAVEARMPATKLTKEEARNLLVKCRKRMEEITPAIAGASKKCRVKHPRLGMLNARQWLKFIAIHLQHHLNQLNRLKNKF